MGSGSVSFSERTVGRAEPKVKKPPLRFTWCGEGAGAATGALGAATGALGAATGALAGATGALGAATGALAAAGALDAATGVWAATGTLWTPAENLEAGTGVLAGAGAAAGWAAAKAVTGILCLALAAEPKVCASSKKVLSPATLLVLVGVDSYITSAHGWERGYPREVVGIHSVPHLSICGQGLGSQTILKFSEGHL